MSHGPSASGGAVIQDLALRAQALSSTTVAVTVEDAVIFARELKALSPEELRACIDGAGLGRSAVYAARGGKAGEPTYRALRAWLDARKR